MKYSTVSSETQLFCEQVQQLTTMYEQWNDCERTVVIYALFKRLPFANLKFLIHSIDHYLKQSFNTPHRLTHFEDAANAVTFLNKLIHKYNTLINITTTSDESDFVSDYDSGSGDGKNLEDDLISKYTSKDEIINDLLMFLPLLRPNNEEGKRIYMQFVPVLIEDSIKHNLPIELVQQILSYLLIHPAIKNDDRKALNQWLRQLEEHIASSYSQNNVGNNFNFLPTDNTSSFLSTASSISSASSSSSALSMTWPTAVPQTLPVLPRPGALNQDYSDDAIQPKYPTPIGSKNAIQSIAKGSNIKPSNSIFESTDEHPISFSKNGKEIVDFDCEFIESSKTATSSLTSASNTNDFLTVPCLFNDHVFDYYGSLNGGDGYSDDGNLARTRRSNSLTTPTARGDFVTSSSAENLSNLLKPRSFSLSIESSRNALVSSGSDTRLDDYNKMGQMRYSNNTNHIGMGHIGVWLKSLRLHKYFWLFSNMGYDQMMEMTEDYLESLGVTKGARHKLVLCIQKLNERVPILNQMEKDLMDGSKHLKTVLDELSNIVCTPMKPINSVPYEEDVGSHFMRVLDCAFQLLMTGKFIQGCEEECSSAFNWLIDKALHHDSLEQQSNRLKEFKYKLQRLKIQFGHNKMHYSNNNKGSKMRWTSTKQIKPTNQPSSDNQPKIHRKSSMQYYNIQSYNQSAGDKSLSYPSFGGKQSTNLNNFQRSISREKLNQFSLMQQQPIHPLHHFNQQVTTPTGQAPPYHRHSLNNLMPFNTAQQQFLNRRNSSCSDRGLLSHTLSTSLESTEKNLSDSGLSTSMSSSSTAPSASDINSRLESLCRQMTEQAIN
ncbi:CLUMA_CG008488, isoform A [Clunio marinus]|uniref:Protein Smaug n=1 Tax=Clunio marinus TaxID=568069 RepID=A0A1J1I5I6_9DIPT|nr:CLUMA_CG008488, isoform A [Clunio marinus]